MNISSEQRRHLETALNELLCSEHYVKPGGDVRIHNVRFSGQIYNDKKPDSLLAVIDLIKQVLVAKSAELRYKDDYLKLLDKYEQLLKRHVAFVEASAKLIAEGDNS